VPSHILPRWADTLITEIFAVDVEEWLGGVKGLPNRSGPGGQPLSPATKAKLRNQLSAFFSHAIRYRRYTGSNPIEPVRQSTRRVNIPVILALSEMISLLANIEPEIDRIAVLMASVTGLRKSELRGLKWCDVDMENGLLHLRRGKIDKFQSRLKTEASRKPYPIRDELIEELMRWRSISRSGLGSRVTLPEG
jgi:integrase